MRTLDRYIGASIAKGYLLVMLILLSVFSFLAFVEELEDLGRGRYHLADACVFVALTLPSRMFDLMPVTALLGSIIALGGLASGYELIAIQAGGVSTLRISWSVIRPGVLLMVAAVAIAQFVAPPLDQLAQTHRSRAISGTGALRTEHGFWSRDGLRFINVRYILYGRILADVDIYEFDEQGQLHIFTHARKADIRGSKEWVLTGVEQKVFGEEHITTRHLSSLVWKSFLGPEQLGLLVLPPQSFSLSDLYLYVRYLRDRGQDADRYELAFWRKISMPIAAGAMVLMGIPFLFGPLRVTSAGQKIMMGSIVGIGFYLGSQIIERLGLLLNLNPALTTMAPVAAVLCLALWLLRRAY